VRACDTYTRGDAYRTPDLANVIHKSVKAQWISSWDIRPGYWQIYVKPEHRWLMAFVTNLGLFEWVRMPFGFKCASNSFITALQWLLFPLRDFCDSYVDDIATFTFGRTEDRQNSWPLHLEQVRAFLLTMRKAGLTLKLEKCKFAQSSVTFVGHRIGSGLHSPDPHKVACVLDVKPPNSKKKVGQILGFFLYFRTYIDRFAEIAKPLTDLTRKQVSGKIFLDLWALRLLKQSLCNATKLHIFEFGKPYKLLVDASNIALGCCLLQWTEGKQKSPLLLLVVN